MARLSRSPTKQAPLTFGTESCGSSPALQVELISRNNRVKVTNPLIAELRKLGEAGVLTEKGEVRWLVEAVTKPIPVESEIGTISSTFVLEPVD